MGKLVNKVELADILGVSERSLTTWQNDEALPILVVGERGQSNQYDTEAVIRWLVQRELRRAQAESPKDRLDWLRGDREELELQRIRRELVPAAEIAPALDQYVGDVTATLEGIPEKYAEVLQQTGDVDGKHQILVEMVHAIREALGDYTFAIQQIDGAVPAAGHPEVQAAA